MNCRAKKAERKLKLSEQRKLKLTFQPEKGGNIIPRNWGKDLETESSNILKARERTGKNQGEW